MNPEEKELLEKTYQLTEENNILLKRLRTAQKRATIYGFIRLAIIILPFIIGYLFLQPYLGSTTDNFRELQSLLN